MKTIMLNGVEYELKETGNNMLSVLQCPFPADECYEEETVCNNLSPLVGLNNSVCKSYKDMVEQVNMSMYDFNNSHQLFSLYGHRDEDLSFNVLTFNALADCVPNEYLENDVPFYYTGNKIVDGARILKANIEANKEEFNEVISEYGIGAVINAAYLAGASSAMLDIGNKVSYNSSNIIQDYMDSAAEYIKQVSNTQKASIVEPLPLKPLPVSPLPQVPVNPFKRRK